MLGKEDWSAASPVSNGPFYILEQQADRMILAKNELYWDASRVSFQRIVVRFASDAAEAASLWDSGTARWIAGDIDLDALRDKSGITVNAMFATQYYYIRSSRSPWNDPRISRALAVSLPWDKIRDGHYLPAETLIFPIPGYPKIDGLKTQDLEEARRLLGEAGYPKGIGLPKLVIKITPSEEAARISAIMAETWMAELGIPVSLETVPFDDYYQSLKKDDYVVGSSTWIGDFADPYTFLQMWQRDSNLNDARLGDDRYEELIGKSMAQEGEDRWKTLSEAEKVLLDRGAVLPISYSPALNIIDVNEIDGWYPNPLDIHPFKYLVFAAFRPLPGVALAPRP
jgi:peptide/nickel transport system substrate-binding protein/oligopeptide transport system substrate-binding protein